MPTSLIGAHMNKVYHGGALDAIIAKYGGTRDVWLDLSTGINPNPYQVPQLAPEVWQQLPDKDALNKLLDAAKAYYQVPDEMEIVAAPGTQAIIELLPYILPAKQVGILSPTYGEHANSWMKADTSVTAIPNLSSNSLLELLDTMVVVNPNNPTGEFHSTDTLMALSQTVEKLIVDEAFCDFFPEKSFVPYMPENAIILKSFGKFFGLAGLRLGFAICSKDIAEKIASRLGPWAIAGPALEIGAKALADNQWIENAKVDLLQASGNLMDLLSQSGFEIEGFNPLFIYAKHADAQNIFERLAGAHILVRNFPERQNCLRFGLCKSEIELARLKEALKADE